MNMSNINSKPFHVILADFAFNFLKDYWNSFRFDVVLVRIILNMVPLQFPANPTLGKIILFNNKKIVNGIMQLELTLLLTKYYKVTLIHKCGNYGCNARVSSFLNQITTFLAFSHFKNSPVNQFGI